MEAVEGSIPTPRTTLVVLLGASEWPLYPDLSSSKAFSNSAQSLKDYLLDSHKFNLPEENLLDLFDSPNSPDAIDEEIDLFLQRRLKEMQTSEHPAQDLLIYYVGHGGFDKGIDYCLAIRRTRQNRLAVSSIRMETLADLVKMRARELRCILILDCCYAASAFEVLQGPVVEKAVQLTKLAFEGASPGPEARSLTLPKRGITLMCSSSRDEASIIGDKYTLFSEALLHVLNTGDIYEQALLSPRAVIRSIKAYLREKYEGVPIPQVHSPKQKGEEVADVPFFPNPVKQANNSSAEDKTKGEWQQEAETLNALERYEDALIAYNHVIRLDPTSASAYTSKVYALNQLKRYEEALDACDRALQLNHQFAIAYNNKGYTLGHMGQRGDALKNLDWAIQLDPNLVVAYNNKASILDDLGRYEEALACYDQAFQIDQGFANTIGNKSVLLVNMDRYEDALDLIKRSIRSYPNESFPYAYQGLILVQLEKPEEALKACEQALLLDPKNPMAWANKGVALAQLKRYEEALAAFEHAIQIEPNDATIYLRKGHALLEAERYEDAIAVFDQGVPLEGKTSILAQIYAYKAMALVKLGQLSESINVMEQAALLDPPHYADLAIKSRNLLESRNPL